MEEEQELHKVGLRHPHWNGRETQRLGFVSPINLTRLDKVFVGLNFMLTSNNNEEMDRALYLMPLWRTCVELYSSRIAIQIFLQWKYSDLCICSTIPGINLGLVGQCSQPLINESSVYNGTMRDMRNHEPYSFEKCTLTSLPLSFFNFS